MFIKRIMLTGLFVVGCLYVAGFSSISLAKDKSDTKQNKENRVSEDKNSYPVIGHLKKKDMIITIRTSPEGLLYTVETKDGKPLAVNLPDEKLYAEFPDLKNDIEKGIAIGDATYRPEKED